MKAIRFVLKIILLNMIWVDLKDLFIKQIVQKI